VSEHGINAECIVSENSEEGPSEEEGGPLGAFNGEEVSHEGSE